MAVIKSKTKYAPGEKLGNWYKNTFEYLGDKWLFDVLKYLIEDGKLPKKFILANLSANLGLYEKKAYDELKKMGCDPEFYLGDLEQNLDGCVNSYDKFYYEYKGKDAAEVDLPNNKKADVILDSKGALWYALKNKNTLIKLLRNYCCLLKNTNSVLLIDSHKPSWLNILSEFTNMLNRKPYHFLELSTYTKFNSILKLIDLKNEGISIRAVQEDREKILTKYLKIHYYTKEELELIISKLENVSDFKYRLQLCKPCTIGRFFHLLIWGFTIMILLFILAILIFRLLNLI